MRVYRLCHADHQKLDGEGARLYGGRWNKRGLTVIYTSMTLSLCVLEQLVHLDSDLIPTQTVAMTIDIPDHLSQEHLSEMPSQGCMTFGNQWIQEKRSLSLVVPSAVIPVEKKRLNQSASQRL